LNRNSPIHARIEPAWADLRRVHNARVPARIDPWLRDRGSLTARLIRACGERFRVRVIRQGWGKPFYSEGQLLGMRRGEIAIVREVELFCSDRPGVFARTLIPASSLRGSVRRLTLLGSRPLGAVLFSDPRVVRGQTQAARLLPRHRLFHTASAHLQQLPAEIWGRRTLFLLNDRPILVNELFLPELPESPK
jgi:chorismate--pyruvate lyase